MDELARTAGRETEADEGQIKEWVKANVGEAEDWYMSNTVHHKDASS